MKIAPFILLSLFASPLIARNANPHIVLWMVPGNAAPPQTVNRDREGFFRIGRIVPTKLFTLPQDAVVPRDGIIAVNAGTLMVPLVDDPYSVCEIRRHEGSAFACLKDTDHDGKFETYFGTQTFNEIFLGSIGDDGGFEDLTQSVSLQEVDPKLKTPEIDLKIKFKKISNGILYYEMCTKITWPSKYFSAEICMP